MLRSLVIAAPGEATVLQFFGRCTGTAPAPGMTSRRKVSSFVAFVHTRTEMEIRRVALAEIAARVE